MSIFLQTKTKTTFIILAAMVVIAGVAFFYSQKPVTKNIIPEGDYKKEALTLNEECLKTANKEACYKAKFTKLAYEQDFGFSVKTLKELGVLDPSARQCHGLAHVVSIASVRKNPAAWIDLIKQADLSMEGCAGGFLHGIVEGHLAYNPEFIVDEKSILEICGQLPKLASNACSHGFGHVLIFQTEDDLVKSSSVCSEVEELASECYNGMFMENSFKDMLVEHGVLESYESPTTNNENFAKVKETCDEFKEVKVASEACWANLGHIIAEFYEFQQKPAFEACNLGPANNERESCYFRAASSLVVLEKFSETSAKLSLCSPYEKEEELTTYLHCTKYVAATLIYHSTEYSLKTIAYCSNIKKEAQDNCFKTVGFMLSERTDAETLENLCKSFPKEYINYCLKPEKINVFSSL